MGAKTGISEKFLILSEIRSKNDFSFFCHLWRIFDNFENLNQHFDSLDDFASLVLLRFFDI